MATTTVKKHPIRGGVWGLFMGIGLALILIGRKIVAFGETGPVVIVIVVGIVIGVLWAMFGPAKDPKGPEPLDMVPGADDDTAFAATGATTRLGDDDSKPGVADSKPAESYFGGLPGVPADEPVGDDDTDDDTDDD